MTAETAKSNALVRQKFSETEDIERINETSAATTSSEARALIESRFVMAIRNPRNWDLVRSELLEACANPDFANDPSTYYRVPSRGEGLGIRFAEMAMGVMRNLMDDAVTVSENEEVRNIKMFVLDLETNVSHSRTVKMPKSIERSKAREDGSFISKRVNSQGYDSFLVWGTDEELLGKESSTVSKISRTLFLKLLPVKLKQECIAAILKKREDKAKEDPEKEKKSVIDAFAKHNISVSDLEDYLEHVISQVTVPELVNLRNVWAGINSGELSWRDVMENIEEMKRRNKPKEAKGVDAAKSKAAEQQTKQTTQAPSEKPADKKEEPAKTQPAQEVKKETKAKEPEKPKPAVTQAQTPTQKEEPKKEEAPKQGNSEPPAWANEDAPADAKPVQPVEKVETAKPSTTNTGKTIKGVQFPEVLKKSSVEDGATDEQIAEARQVLSEIGPNFQLEGAVKKNFEIELDEINQEAMSCVIQALKNMLAKMKAK